MQNRILFVTYENPFTKNSGDSIYTCTIIEALKSLEFEIDIIYFDSNKEERKINHEDIKLFNDSFLVKFRKKNLLSFVFSLQPGMVVNRRLKNFNRKLNQLLKIYKYSHVFINHQKMLFTLSEIKNVKTPPKLIYISHNVEYLLSRNLSKFNVNFLLRLLHWQDSLKTFFFEKNKLKQFDVVTAISEHDQEFFKSIYNLKNVAILRPVVKIKDRKIDHNKKKPSNLIIAGSFEWLPKKQNLLLFLNAKNFKELIANGITVYIVGKSDPEFVGFINKNYSGVKMTGPVESLEPYYDECQIAVVPEKLGGGFKLKVIEAAISKTAIFSISGAILKSNFKKEEHFIEEPTFEELISAIIKFQNNPKGLFDMIENSYKLVVKEYSFSSITDQLKNITL